MAEVARRLLVYAHRPGSQSQFSATLEAQVAAGGTFSALIEWVEASLHESIDVAALARRARMSERTFYRRFTAATGATPSHWLATLRLERGKRLLEAGAQVKQVAAAVGFHSGGGFRAAFTARFGVGPSTHRLLQGEPTSPPQPPSARRS